MSVNNNRLCSSSLTENDFNLASVSLEKEVIKFSKEKVIKEEYKESEKAFNLYKNSKNELEYHFGMYY